MISSNQGRQMSTAQEIAVETFKAAPPVTAVGLSLAGVTLQDWVLIGTLIYTVLQIGFLIRDKWWRKRNWRGHERRRGS